MDEKGNCEQERMKIKKLYANSPYVSCKVIKAMDGKFYMFFSSRFRYIKQKDLVPLHGFEAVGKYKEEAREYFYRFYGFEKAEGEQDPKN